jgi:membrane protease YdiL (CAAX protease family)
MIVQNQTTAARLSRADIILLACGPYTVLFILDGYFRHSLYSYSPALYWLFDGIKFVLLPAAILIWLGRRHGITPARYGMRAVAENESWVHFLGLTIFIAIMLYAVYIATHLFTWIILDFPESTAFYKSIRPDGLLRVPVVLYYAITAGVVEEIFWRALPLLYLSERFGKQLPKGAYVVTTAILFGAAHWENGPHEALATCIFGMFASAFYLKLRDLWPLIGAHTLIDVWGFW